MKLANNWRILMLLSAVLLSLALLAVNGLSFGIDFTGGTELKLELEEGGEDYTSAVREILANRLNSMGLKSTQVLKEADGRHITVKVSTTDTQDLLNVKNIINQQAVFEQMVEGNLCARGDEIQLDITNRGGVFVTGSQWQVSVKTSGESPERCGDVMENKAGHMTDIFLDRPSKSFMLLEKEVCDELSSTLFVNHPEDSGYTQLSFIEDRALIPVVCYTTEEKPEDITPEENASAEENETTLLDELDIGENETEISLLADLGLDEEEPEETEELAEENITVLDLSETVAEMQRLSGEGKSGIIIMVPTEELPTDLQNKISEINLTVRIYEKDPSQPFQQDNNPDSWIQQVTGLKSTLSIGEGLTYGNPVYNSVFEGSGSSNAAADEIAERFRIWLTSGNLPVKTKIILERPNLPELGAQFLNYIGIIALIALFLVAAIVSIRFRELKISAAILTTSFSEIIMILGFASLFAWELDLAAMAGIIAAIGTGVDHQIIITDETLRGERKKKDDKIWDVKQSIDRAFFIILTSAATTICAMLPLMSIIDLRGFAFTSIVGIFIGILISRPAYGRIVELIT